MTVRAAAWCALALALVSGCTSGKAEERGVTRAALRLRDTTDPEDPVAVLAVLADPEAEIAPAPCSVALAAAAAERDVAARQTAFFAAFNGQCRAPCPAETLAAAALLPPLERTAALAAGCGPDALFEGPAAPLAAITSPATGSRSGSRGAAGSPRRRRTSTRSTRSAAAWRRRSLRGAVPSDSPQTRRPPRSCS